MATANDDSFSFGFTQDAQRRHNNRTASSGVSWTDILYDANDQLAGAQMSPGWPVGFAYDDSGNRTSFAVADHPLVAGQDPPGGQFANALDQISARTLKYRGFGVAGSVKPKAKVKAWTSFTPWWIPIGVDPVTGAFFSWWDVPFTYNDGAALPVESHVQGMLPPAPGKKPAVAQVSMHFVVAPANEALVHDVAGRLAADAFWFYTWDDAGRLTGMARKTDTYAIAGTQEETLEFGYDADNRRTRWKHRRTDADGEHIETSQVLWAGCLPVMEDRTREGSALPRRWFQWGADLSGTLGGAGGIGGLVAIIEDGGRTLLPVQDGLGNITAVIDKADGQTVAQYNFGPFGEPIGESGEADACPFRWQTRWWDPVCEQYNFVERAYSPRLGRWLSRDPIGEAGGFNLYAYCGNDPVNRHDPLGLAGVAETDAESATLLTFLYPFHYARIGNGKVLQYHGSVSGSFGDDVIMANVFALEAGQLFFQGLFYGSAALRVAGGGLEMAVGVGYAIETGGLGGALGGGILFGNGASDSKMNVLFLYHADGKPFDRDAICRCLRSLSSLSEFEMEPDEFASCRGRFYFGNEANLIELKKSLEVIVLGREGRAALRLAFEIQQLYPHRLNVTNESNTIEICVKDFRSYQEFEMKCIAELSTTASG